MKIQSPKQKTAHTPFIKREQQPLFQKQQTISKANDTSHETLTEPKVDDKATKKNGLQSSAPTPTFFPPKAQTVTQHAPKPVAASPTIKETTQPEVVQNKVPESILKTKNGTIGEPLVKTKLAANTTETTNKKAAVDKKDTANEKLGKKKPGAAIKSSQAPIVPKAGDVQVEKKSAVEVPAKEVQVNLPTENSHAFTKGLASQPPANFVRGLQQSGPELQQTLTNEKDSLKESLPEIEQPTGITTKKAHTESKQKMQADKDAATIQNSKSELQDLSPTGKKEGEKVAEESKQPKSTFLDKVKSFFSFFGSDSDKKSSVKSGIRKLPTSENVNTDPGNAPNVDLTGQANPKQNTSNKQASDSTMQDAQQKNKTESDLYKGEDDIYPEMELETLSPTTELTPAQASSALEKGLPPVTGEVETAFNANSRAHFDTELAPQVEKQDAEYKKMEQDQDKEQRLADQKIEDETQRVKSEQEAAQTGAKKQVSAARSQWKKENEDVKKEYATKSEKEKKRIDGEIDTKVAETDTQVTKEYDAAEKKADTKVAETNKEAKKRKKEAKAKSEKKSWWDRAVDAVSDFFDALKEGLNKLFDGLKSLVKGIIEAAKKLVNKLIDLARDFVVGLIKAFGEILKGLVNIALAAFPKLRDKFNAAIDKAVDMAVKTVNALAEGLKKAVNMLLDALGKVLDFILSAYQAIFNAILDVLKFLAVGLIRVMQFLWNLIKGAGIAPFEFFGQLAEEALGGNPADPLKDIEVPLGQEENWASAMGLSKGEEKADASLQTEAMSKEVQQLLTKKELADNDVTVEPYPAVSLSPELLTQVSNLKDGEPYELGGAADPVSTQQFQASAADASGYSISAAKEPTPDINPSSAKTGEATETPNPDWRNMTDDEKLTHHNTQMLTESAAVGDTKPTPEGKKAATPTVDNSPAALITKTGRLDVARRLAFMGEQMMTGLQVFWNKNKVWIIAALVAALIAAGLIAFFTGGAGLIAAVDIIAKALIIIFGAIAVFKAMGYIWEYVKKAWAGDAQGAGKALARALAVIVVEFLIDKILLGMGKVFKRILNAAKATKIGRIVTKGAGVVRKGVQKGTNVVKKGISKIKNSKLVVKLSGGVGKGVKKLGKLRQKILNTFKFKRIWFVRKGAWIELWGEFNAKALLSKTNTKTGQQEISVVQRKSSKLRKDMKQRDIVGHDLPNLKKTDPNIDVDGIIISDASDSAFALRMKQLQRDGNQAELIKEYNRLKNINTAPSKLVKRRKSKIYDSGTGGTAELRIGIKGKQPANFEAHHLIPRETLKKFDGFFKKIGFDIENGAINGLMVPPNKEALDALKLVDPSEARKYSNYAFHKGSHKDYTNLIEEKLTEIKRLEKAKQITSKEALEAVKEVADDAKKAIMKGNRPKKKFKIKKRRKTKKVNDVTF